MSATRRGFMQGALGILATMGLPVRIVRNVDVPLTPPLSIELPEVGHGRWRVPLELAARRANSGATPVGDSVLFARGFTMDSIFTTEITGPLAVYGLEFDVAARADLEDLRVCIKSLSVTGGPLLDQLDSRPWFLAEGAPAGPKYPTTPASETGTVRVELCSRDGTTGEPATTHCDILITACAIVGPPEAATPAPDGPSESVPTWDYDYDEDYGGGYDYDYDEDYPW